MESKSLTTEEILKLKKQAENDIHRIIAELQTITSLSVKDLKPTKINISLGRYIITGINIELKIL